jgi:hypothetical protein
MDLPVEHEAFRARRLVVRTAGFFTNPQILVDGVAATGKRLAYRVRDDAGLERSAVLKPTFLDPIPRLQIDTEAPIQLARPLRWYEWAWMALPVSLLLVGGALGGLLGVTAVLINSRIFRSDRTPASRYVLTALVSGGCVAFFVVGASAVQIAFR